MRSQKQLGELQERIAELKERLHTLGDTCLQAGEKLKTSGLIPDPALGEALAQAREDYDRLAADCRAAAQGLLPENVSKKTASLAKLEELCHELEKHLAAPQGKKDWTSSLLATARRITLQEGEEAAELADFRKKLDSYAQILDHRGENETAVALRQQLQAGTHPLNALFKLLEGNLSYREAAGVFSVVAAEFGTPLAVAAVQGSLIFPDSKDNDTPQFSTGLTIVAEDRLLCSPKLICELIRAGKLGPAYWLACYNEQGSGDVPVPSWLIRALGTADLLQGEGGKAAECLAYLYAQHDFVALSVGEPSSRLPMALLVFAALLRPALLSPDTGAASLLGKMQNLPRSLQGLATALAEKNAAVKSAWREELQNLSLDVQSWFRQNQKLALASPIASRLWEKMLEEGGLIHRLLYPLLEKSRQMPEDTRQLCIYLGEKDNLTRELGMLYKEVAGPAENIEIFHIPGSWQIINRLKTALKFAEQHLQLSEKIAEKEETEEVAPAEKLFAFWEPAREELREIARQGEASPLLPASLAVVRRALNSLEKLLQEDDPQLLTPANVLSLELKNNPQLMLKPSWQPQKETVERLGKALLELLNEQYRSRKTSAEGDFYVVESPVTYGEKSPALPADLDDLYRSGSLTLQEREFIQDIFKSISG